jgi:hypothetical protein
MTALSGFSRRGQSLHTLGGRGATRRESLGLRDRDDGFGHRTRRQVIVDAPKGQGPQEARGGRSELPEDVKQFRQRAAQAASPEAAIAINTAILRHNPADTVALNRLGRAYEAIGSIEQAKQTFQEAVARSPHWRGSARRARMNGRWHRFAFVAWIGSGSMPT